MYDAKTNVDLVHRNASANIQVNPTWRWSPSNPTLCFHSLLLNLETLNFLGIDLSKKIMLYYKQEKSNRNVLASDQSSFGTSCFCAFPEIATEHPLCRS